MAAERREPRDSFLTGGTTARYGRVHTPVPESRERATETGLDAREVGTSELRQQEVASNASARTGSDYLPVSSDYLPVSHVSRDAPTEPASALDEDVSELSLEPPALDTLTRGVGYYSIRPPRATGVEIPRAPRVPELDLDGLDLPPVPRRSGVRTRRFDSSQPSDDFRPETQRSDSYYPETIRTPPPDAAVPSVRAPSAAARVPGSSAPPPPMQEAQTLAPPSPGRSPRRSSYPAPRIYFAPHVRSQANQWAQTGSLSLPGCSSPRHARALQRALLLALLHEPGWDQIPQGLQQRAGWLFCDGWESNSEGHAFREIDDLATVLGLPAGKDSRRLLALAIAGVLPEGLSVRRAPSSAPPARR